MNKMNLFQCVVIMILMTSCGSPASTETITPIPTSIPTVTPTNTSIPSPTSTSTPKPPSVITPENVTHLTEMNNAEIAVEKATFSPDGRFLMGESQCCAIDFYDVSSLELVRTISPDVIVVPEPGKYFPQGHALSPDGSVLVIGLPPINSVGLAGLWDANTGNHIRLSEKEGRVIDMFGSHIAGIQFMSFSPDGRILAMSDTDNVAVWEIDAVNQQVKMASIVEIHNRGVSGGGITDIAFSPDGQVFALIRNGQVKFRNTQTWKASPIELDTSKDETDYKAIYKMVFSLDGKVAATVNSENEIKLWDMETGQLLNTMIDPTDSELTSYEVVTLALSPDGQLLLLADAGNQTLRFWEMNTGQLLHTVELEDFMNFASFSPDGTSLAVSFMDHIEIFGVP